MEKRTVRIYKAPDGQGRYVNKTQQFMQKAQMGAEVSNENNDVKAQIQALEEYISGALDNDMEPEMVYKQLVSKGLPKDVVYSLLTKVMQEREEPIEEENPEEKSGENTQKIGQSEYKPIEQEEEEVPEEVNAAMQYYNSYSDEDNNVSLPDDEYQDGGPISYDQLSSSEEEEQEEPDMELMDKLSQLSAFVDDVSGKIDNEPNTIADYEDAYTPIEWDMLDDGYGVYKHGGSKKSFTKNILALVKKQQGGDNKAIGQGNKKDTITNDVASIKNNFLNKLKEVSNKAAVDSLYEKMMNSKDPQLMQSAQEIAEQRNKPQVGTFEEAQSGGFIGQDQPEAFMYGGSEMPFYQDGQIPEAQKGVISGKAYNARTKEAYTDSFEGLNPYAKTVHKRGLFGRPKQWTEYYSRGSGSDKQLTPGQEIKAAYEKQMVEDNSLKHGVEKDVWDTLSGKAKRQIRRGERRLGRDIERGVESMKEDAEFNKGVHAQYKYNNEEDLARDLKRSDKAWKKDKSFVSDIDYSVKDPYKDFVYSTHDIKGNRYEEPRVVAMPELLPTTYTDVKFEMPERLLQEQEEADALENKTLRFTRGYRKGGNMEALRNYFQPGGALGPDLSAALKPKENQNTLLGATQPMPGAQPMPVNPDANKVKTVEMDPNQTKDQKITSLDFGEPKNDDLIAIDKQRAPRNFDGQKAVDAFNVGANAITGFMNNLDAAKKEKEMYENNFTSDNLYAATNSRNRGDYVDYGQQLGQFRYDQMGSDTSGQFAYGQSGGYMQDGGQTYEFDVDDEVDMTPEELEAFLAAGGEIY